MASQHALPLVHTFQSFLAPRAPNGEGQRAEAGLRYLSATFITVAIRAFGEPRHCFADLVQCLRTSRNLCCTSPITSSRRPSSIRVSSPQRSRLMFSLTLVPMNATPSVMTDGCSVIDSLR